ncbi:GIY-YIG nuclease family protein [Streptantibioticus ferralitis]|uniref:GIY-YIG nuclease family protein n=1 Tax=Streptantibioticus ferralitis TaxID=236510 RepID=A0ABT5YW76_9ACTN|nr:GIY-YIG nuclease family protein [Streptantibioticus ferralitis]MDF2255837.1 GIY-YIG nuclease family protein [Streptantibioticus ferralitis]
MTAHDTGFVYVMSNPAMPDMVKIGFTTLLPEARAKKLSDHSGVPLPFEVRFRALTMRWPAVERLVHRRLDGQRVSPRREFFTTSIESAVETVRECVLEVNGIDAWVPEDIRTIGGQDRIVLPLEAGEVFILLAQPAPLTGGGWQPLDLWQAHSTGDQLEIYAAERPADTAGFSDGDAGGDVDPVPYLDASRLVANGVLNGKERLAPGDRLLWLRDADGPDSCTSVLFEAKAYCQVACRTWSPQFTPEGFPLVLNALGREPSTAMISAGRSACDLPGPRTWGPRPKVREEPAFPVPGPERWLPQLQPKSSRRPLSGEVPGVEKFGVRDAQMV